MKASFIKRLSSFVVDTMIISFVFSLITMGFTVNTDQINDELGSMFDQYENSEITLEEYTDKVIDLNHELQKNMLTTNILEVVLYVGYFVVFGYLNKGQTLGKKLCKIKIVNKEGSIPNIWNMIIRSLFIYGISTLLFSTIFVNIFSSKVFTYGYTIITYIEVIIMFTSFFMIIYKKDGRGLHDIIAKTYVIEEVK